MSGFCREKYEGHHGTVLSYEGQDIHRIAAIPGRIVWNDFTRRVRSRHENGRHQGTKVSPLCFQPGFFKGPKFDIWVLQPGFFNLGSSTWVLQPGFFKGPKFILWVLQPGFFSLGFSFSQTVLFHFRILIPALLVDRHPPMLHFFRNYEHPIRPNNVESIPTKSGPKVLSKPAEPKG